MAQVFLARQQNLERLVAIKLLAPSDGVGDHEQRKRDCLRFEREARLMAQVSHPNVVTVFDRGTAAGRDYLVMEYVEGVSLRGLLEAGLPLAVPQARRILREVAQALAHLHDRGIIHRDVKPENVLVSRNGTVRVTDFGIAFLTGEEGVLTHSSQAVGTLDYMAPEQRARLPVDARADQFALAVMAYELLTGKRPLGHIKPPSRLNAALDPRVDEVLLRALRQEPEDRYPHVPAFAGALDRALGQAPRRRQPRVPALLALAVGLAVGLGAGLALAHAFLPEPAPPRAATAGLAPEPLRRPGPPTPEATRPAPQPAAPDLPTLVQLADGHAKRGRHREAVAAFDAAVRLSPNDPSLPYRQGEVYLRMENYPLAIAAYSKAVGLDPKNPAYRRRRGWAYFMNHQNREAVGDLTEATAGDPKDAQSFRNLGCAYVQLSQFDQALRALDEATRLEPNNGFFWYLRGQAYEAKGDHRQARDDYRRATRLNPYLTEPYRALAVLLVRSEDPAVRDAEQAAAYAWKAYDASNGTDWQVLRALALVHAAAGDLPAAVRWCKKALEIAPPGSRPDLQKRLAGYAQRVPPAGGARP
jgi:tetratricopeptide (TPR) repeat protein